MSGYNLEARIAQLERQVARLETQRGTPFAAGRTTMEAKDTGNALTIQAELDAFSTRDGIPVLFNYGHFANLPTGTDVHIAFLDGDRSQAVAIASNHQSIRMKNTSPGDTGLFAHGLIIHLKSGVIEITGVGQWTGDVKLIGNLRVTGEVTAMADGPSVTLSQHRDPQGGPPIPHT